ncbi:pre-rRNA processing protein [Coemansia sp. RSA 1199]|nr:pre-rRNA processing protein [Coemansia sp. RSA 1199]
MKNFLRLIRNGLITRDHGARAFQILANNNEGAAPKPSVARKGKGNTGTVYGCECRSKKAQGDVKRGNVDPYAYIPLNPKTMKKDAIAIKGNLKKDKRTRSVKG